MRFDEQFLQEVKERNNIVDLIGSYLPLKKAGRLFSGLCPFHAEKTPSFMVYPDTQSYYCFGCGAGGDAITFIMERENLSYPEAVAFLAERAGMKVPEDDAGRELTDLRQRLREMNREAAVFYHQVLCSDAGRPAREYLENRGFDFNIIRHFGIGFAPDQWRSVSDHLRRKGFHETEMQQGWLYKKTDKGGYDLFRNRVMFPVFDLRGNVVAFSGRTLSKEDPRKYLNSGDTPLFSKGRFLFAMNFAKKFADKSLILCEGNLDVVAMHRAGFQNTVASLGTALTEEQVRLISSYTDRVYLLYDSDGAGQKAIERAIPLLQARGLQIRIPVMTGAKDPDEYLKKFGALRFSKMMEESIDATDWQIRRAGSGMDLQDPAQKAVYFRSLLPTLARLSHVEQDIQLSRLSQQLNIAKEALIADLRIYIKKQAKKKENADRFDLSLAGREHLDKLNPEKNRHFRAARSEELLLGWLMAHPEFYPFCADKIRPEDFITPLNRRIAETLFSNLKAGAGADLCLFRERFTAEETGRISGLIARLPAVTDPEATLQDCIDNILSEGRKKSSEQVAKLDDDDLLSFIDHLRKGKD